MVERYYIVCVQNGIECKPNVVGGNRPSLTCRTGATDFLYRSITTGTFSAATFTVDNRAAKSSDKGDRAGKTNNLCRSRTGNTHLRPMPVEASWCKFMLFSHVIANNSVGYTCSILLEATLTVSWLFRLRYCRPHLRSPKRCSALDRKSITAQLRRLLVALHPAISPHAVSPLETVELVVWDLSE